MDDELKKNAYATIRLIECLCIGIFIFGFLWEGTEILRLTFPEFMMVYGLIS